MAKWHTIEEHDWWAPLRSSAILTRRTHLRSNIVIRTNGSLSALALIRNEKTFPTRVTYCQRLAIGRIGSCLLLLLSTRILVITYYIRRSHTTNERRSQHIFCRCMPTVETKLVHFVDQYIFNLYDNFQPSPLQSITTVYARRNWRNARTLLRHTSIRKYFVMFATTTLDRPPCLFN